MTEPADGGTGSGAGRRSGAPGGRPGSAGSPVGVVPKLIPRPVDKVVDRSVDGMASRPRPPDLSSSPTDRRQPQRQGGSKDRTPSRAMRTVSIGLFRVERAGDVLPRAGRGVPMRIRGERCQRTAEGCQERTHRTRARSRARRAPWPACPRRSSPSSGTAISGAGSAGRSSTTRCAVSPPVPSSGAWTTTGSSRWASGSRCPRWVAWPRSRRRSSPMSVAGASRSRSGGPARASASGGGSAPIGGRRPAGRRCSTDPERGAWRHPGRGRPRPLRSGADLRRASSVSIWRSAST